MQLVHIDSTQLDIELRSSISGHILGKPWLTLAICAATRRVVGMYLTFCPPSHVSAMMVLADIVRRTGRLPDALIHDHGSEFKAKVFEDCVDALYIKKFTRPKSAGRFGSVLERMFGIVTQRFIQNLAGNTKLRKHARQMSPHADPSQHSGLWLLDLYLALEELLFVDYNNTQHPRILLSPNAATERSDLVHGVAKHRVRSYEDLLPILMPIADGRPRVLDPVRGVFVNGRYYGHPSFANLHRSGEGIVVKPVPFDPGTILALDHGQWVCCRGAVDEWYRDAHEHVRRCFYEEWRLELRYVREASDATRRRWRERMDELNEKAKRNVRYFTAADQDLRDDAIDLQAPDSLVEAKLARIAEIARQAILNAGLTTPAV